MSVEQNGYVWDIAEDLLQRTGACLLSGNFDGFAPCFMLPTVIETFDSRIEVETLAGLRERFRGVVDHLRACGVTELHRRVIAAEHICEGRFCYTHESRLLRGLELVQEPFAVYSEVQRTDGAWRVASSSYAIPDQPAYNRALQHGAQAQRLGDAT